MIRNKRGITLISLIITIIVLLILAGVAINMVLGDNGIINKSKISVDKYSVEEAKERIVQAMITMKMDKMINQSNINGIDDLLETAPGGGLKSYDNKIDSIEKSGDKALLTYDGKYIFEVDERLNVTYVGLIDGLIVTASVSGGGGWIKNASDSTVIISGRIKASSGTIAVATITKEGETAENLIIAGDGLYTKSITESGTYTVYAKDSNNKENSKSVIVNIQVDGDAPTITSVNASYADGKITINAVATDAISGIDYLTYSVKEKGGDETELNTSAGMKQNEVIVNEGKKYEIIVTAFDKAGNSVSSSKQEIITGYISIQETSAQVGDFIDYATILGTWSTTVNYDTLEYGQFGGMTAGTYKGTSIDTGYPHGRINAGSKYHNTYNGWRIYAINSNSITIISAGTPEIYKWGTGEANWSGAITLANNEISTNYSITGVTTSARSVNAADISAMNNSLKGTGAYYWVADHAWNDRLQCRNPDGTDFYLTDGYQGSDWGPVGLRPIIVIDASKVEINREKGTDVFGNSAWLIRVK